MFPEQFSLTWSPELWTQSEPDLSEISSDQTTLSSDNPEQETTGPRDTTPREQSLSTRS